MSTIKEETANYKVEIKSLTGTSKFLFLDSINDVEEINNSPFSMITVMASPSSIDKFAKFQNSKIKQSLRKFALINTLD